MAYLQHVQVAVAGVEVVVFDVDQWGSLTARSRFPMMTERSRIGHLNCPRSSPGEAAAVDLQNTAHAEDDDVT
jgi:hypothetical protein